jgi:hypothetical protein
MKFLIESPHTKEECLKALDETREKGPKALAAWSWGCKAGEHCGYAILEAETEADARAQVPGVVRAKARLHPVTPITEREIEQYHRM